ncbi:MAG: SDR family oxidoreductase [Sphingobacteriales bacterium]
MKITGNAVLITGGGSGIGLATAKALSSKGNFVILVGRNKTKLKNAVNELQNAAYIECDITDEERVNQLVKQVQADFENVNMIINNAGKAYAYTLWENAAAFTKAYDEMFTNFLSTVRLIEKFIPLLKNKPEAAIINNTSITAFVPGASVPTYSASKAALHSYTQSLRLSLSKFSSIKVFEVMPPLVDTEFSKDLPGEKIPASEVAEAIIQGLEQDTYEIHVGITAALHQLFLQSPTEAFNRLNRVNA